MFTLQATCLLAQAQQATWKFRADVKKIDSGGIYKIELQPGLIAKSGADLDDIRLFDNAGKTVAYALSNTLSLVSPENFIEFPQVSTDINTDTVYIAANKNKLPVTQLWIKLKNTSVSRTVNLSGSDDLNKWFAIKEDIPLQDAGEGNRPDYEQSFSFPPSNYRYFAILVNGKNKAPVKIIEAGIYAARSSRPEFTLLPKFKFVVKDTGSKTNVIVNLAYPYRVDKLHFSISSPKYYSRRIIVYALNANAANGYDAVADTVLSSSGTHDVSLSAKSKLLKVFIFNGDDNPLHIKAIQAYQLKQYAISYLEGGHSYYILTGNPQAKKVEYDLSFLKYGGYNELMEVSHSAVYKNPAYHTVTAVKHNFTIWLWLAIAVVLVLLSSLTAKMVREIK